MNFNDVASFDKTYFFIGTFYVKKCCHYLFILITHLYLVMGKIIVATLLNHTDKSNLKRLGWSLV